MADDTSPSAPPPPVTAGGAVLGIGIDVVENARVGSAIREFGNRFLNRVFLPSEIEYCQSMARPTPHFAARFAAKEAIAKAFGEGIGKEIGWLDIEVRRSDAGRPLAALHGNGAALAFERGVGSVLLSLTHTAHYAAANAVLIGLP